MDRLEARLGRHCCNIEGHQRDINQLSEGQVTPVTRMTGYEEKACHCGAGSDRLSNLSYQEPTIANMSGTSFLAGQSSISISVPPLVSSVQAVAVAVPPPRSSGSSLLSSSHGSFKSAQPIVTELVEIAEIPEVDFNMDDAKAEALSNWMDAKVRSCLFQQCKSKNHPEQFLPYPKGHKSHGFAHQGQQSFQRGGAERERFVQTRNLQEGLLGNTDVESEHSGSSSGDQSGSISSWRPPIDLNHWLGFQNLWGSR